LTEGLALYEELDVYGVEWAKGYGYESYYTGSELRSNFIQLDEVKAYKQSLKIVSSLIKNYGRNKLVNLLGELKTGNNLDSSFAKVYGMSLNEFIDSGKW
ncbi:MAG: peptidase MA family metallohydrolase, partial [Caulobacteraceae bacterium]